MSTRKGRICANRERSFKQLFTPELNGPKSTYTRAEIQFLESQRTTNIKRMEIARLKANKVMENVKQALILVGNDHAVRVTDKLLQMNFPLVCETPMAKFPKGGSTREPYLKTFQTELLCMVWPFSTFRNLEPCSDLDHKDVCICDRLGNSQDSLVKDQNLLSSLLFQFCLFFTS